MNSITSEQAQQDLKDIIVDLIAKVPGKNKKIDPKVRRRNNRLFIYVGTTEFDGQTVLFFAKIFKTFKEIASKADRKSVYSFSIEPLNDYYVGDEIKSIFGDDSEHDEKAIDNIRKKLAKYNAYDLDERAGDLDYSFLYHKFTNVQTPRMFWFTEELLKLEPKIMEYDYEPQADFTLSDLTAAEVKKAEQIGPDVKLPNNLTVNEEDKHVKKATDAFLFDLARIYHKLPDQRDSHYFNVNDFFEDDEDNDPLLYGPIVYNDQDYNQAIVFTDVVAPDHKCQVEIYDKKGKMVGTDTVRILCDTYELRYGLFKVAAKENKDLIVKLNKKYDNDAYPEFNDRNVINKISRIFDIDLAKIVA